jgi:hypothetical protein
MPSLDVLDPETRTALASLAGRLKHDLGRYVAMQARWLAPDADADTRRTALRDDLLATRRGPEGSVDALGVWTPYRDALLGRSELAAGVTVDLGHDPDVRRIVSGMATLGEIIAALRGGTLDDNGVDLGLAASTAVAEACRDLHRRAREKSDDHG